MIVIIAASSIIMVYVFLSLNSKYEYPPQILVSSATVADVVIMEPSKIKTSTVFHEYYQLDIAA